MVPLVKGSADIVIQQPCPQCLGQPEHHSLDLTIHFPGGPGTPLSETLDNLFDQRFRG